LPEKALKLENGTVKRKGSALILVHSVWALASVSMFF
jgi:hypothetical protein